MRQPTAGWEDDELTTVLSSLEPEIRRLLLRFRIPAQDAEDLLQDSILVYLTKRSVIHSPGPWMLTALKNRCLVYWRSRRRSLIHAIDEGLLEEMAGSVPDAPGRSDLARDLSGALSHLPDRCKHVLRMRYGLECENTEIANRLGYRVDTVRQVTLRCLSALSRQLLAGGYSPSEACVT